MKRTKASRCGEKRRKTVQTPTKSSSTIGFKINSAGTNWKQSTQKKQRTTRNGNKVHSHSISTQFPPKSTLTHQKANHGNVHSFPRGKVDINNRLKIQKPKQRKTKKKEIDEAIHRFDSPNTQSLDDEIEAVVQLITLTDPERQSRARLFADVQKLINAAFRDATVQLYGSSSSGLETFRSDLDITVGNIHLTSSQRLPGRMLDQLVEGEEDDDDDEEEQDAVKADTNELLHSVVNEKVIHTIPSSLQEEAQVSEEEELSFSLNLVMPAAPTLSSSASSRSVRPFTSVVSAPAKSPWNPTQRRRKLRILRALQFLLKNQRPQFQIKCLPKAKIPILMVLDTKTQICMDIGINRESFETSDHGRTTSLVIQLQKMLGKPFTTLVIFLKEFLHQFDLDKPFTGGIGSFRLYIMVAYLFPWRFKGKQTIPSVSRLLLMFFELYGNKKNANFFNLNTRLSLPGLQIGDEPCEVDFSSVFRINDCVDTFAMAFDILHSTKSLGSIIYEDTLAKDRETSRSAI